MTCYCGQTLYWLKSWGGSTYMTSEKELQKETKSLPKLLISETINNNIHSKKHSFSELNTIREDRMEAKIISTISFLLAHYFFLLDKQFRGFLSCSKLCLCHLWVLLHYFHPFRSLPVWSLLFPMVSQSLRAAHSQVYAISTTPWSLQAFLSQHAHLPSKGGGSLSLPSGVALDPSI